MVLSPMDIGKHALDQATRAMERAERARRAQKGGPTFGERGDHEEEEEGGYPHYSYDDDGK